MRYLMAILTPEADRPDPDATAKMSAEFERYTREMIKAGVRIDGYALTPSNDGKRVQVRSGARKVIDGPFTETKEVLAGLYVMEVASEAEAIAWAERCPAAAYGTLELRRIIDLPY